MLLNIGEYTNIFEENTETMNNVEAINIKYKMKEDFFKKTITFFRTAVYSVKSGHVNDKEIKFKFMKKYSKQSSLFKKIFNKIDTMTRGINYFYGINNSVLSNENSSNILYYIFIRTLNITIDTQSFKRGGYSLDSIEEQDKILLSKRSNNMLDTSKLESMYNIKNIKDSVAHCIDCIAKSAPF